jgi:hypothetical protein
MPPEPRRSTYISLFYDRSGRRALLSLGVIAMLVSACGGARSGGTEQTVRPTPPPKIGSSITHSRMCSCRSCPLARCCSGEEIEEERCEEAEGGRVCGLFLSSCVSRCTTHVWRVRMVDSCKEPVPAECCR